VASLKSWHFGHRQESTAGKVSVAAKSEKHCANVSPLLAVPLPLLRDAYTKFERKKTGGK